MRTQYLGAIAIAAVVAGAGLAVHSVQGQALYPEAVRLGLLAAAEQPASAQPGSPARQLAVRLAETVDPFLRGTGA
jgi:hypothetical protein